MLIVAIYGGLGNQMFQYAFGLSQKKQKKTALLLDVSMYKKETSHTVFELLRLFSITTPIATTEEIRELIGWRATGIGREIMARRRYQFLKGKRYYRESSPLYDESILAAPSDCYFKGHWQSEKYFIMNGQDVRKAFSFKVPMSPINQSIAEKMDKCNSIAVHVRRGDALLHPGSAMATCPHDYYVEALTYMKKRVESPVFFLFSDDITWVKNNMDIEGKCYFLEHNKEDESYNDMQLMSLCKHNVIANSSFSWWGAWLNQNKNKIVVGPRRWFKDETFNSLNIVPQEWKLL